MPTLGETCTVLHVSRRTLDKWLQRLQITPERHLFDYRFYIITDDEVQRIREVRAQMPGQQKSSFIPSYSPLAFDRSQSDNSAVRDTSPARPVGAFPVVRATARHVGPSGDVLPAGMMSRTDVADLHNFPRSTLRRWCDDGRVETSLETYGGEHGQFATARPVTAHGLAEFYALASHRPDFQRCPDCPHTASASVESSGALEKI